MKAITNREKKMESRVSLKKIKNKKKPTNLKRQEKHCDMMMIYSDI